MNEINLLRANSSKLKEVYLYLKKSYNLYQSATHAYKTSLDERINMSPSSTLFIPFSINKHAMLLIVDPFRLDVELFDPMGRDDIPPKVKRFIDRNFPTYSLLRPNLFFPEFSFQKYEKLLDTKKRGNCSWWVAWYIIYRSINPTVDRKVLADRAIRHIFSQGPHQYMKRFKGYLD